MLGIKINKNSKLVLTFFLLEIWSITCNRLQKYDIVYLMENDMFQASLSALSSYTNDSSSKPPNTP
jgi:hypothetical protein